MNKNNKYTSRIAAMKNSRFGKIARRVMGEESGQAMMEYVIIATAIAAAVSLSAWLFGSQIRAGFLAMSHAIMGNHTQSAQITQMAQDLTVIRAAIATQNGGKFTDSCPAKTVEHINNAGTK